MSFPLPGGEENYILQLEYRHDSRLLKAEWMDTSNGNYDTCLRRWLEMRGEKFRKVSEESYPADHGFCSTY